MTQTLFDWSRYASCGRPTKRVARAETRLRGRQAAAADSRRHGATSTCSRQRTISRRPSRTAKASRGSSSKRSAASRSDSSRSPTCSSRKPAYDDAVADEIEAQRLLATSHEFLREIIGEIIMDLAGPTDDLPLLSPDPANAEEWVQTALRQNLAPDARAAWRRTSRSTTSTIQSRQSAADVEPVGQLQRSTNERSTQTFFGDAVPGNPAFDDAARWPQLVAGFAVPDLHGRLEPVAHPAIGLHAPRRDRGAGAHRAADGAANARRVSRRDLGDLARARAAAGRRVEPHGVARHGGRLRGRHADDRRRAPSQNNLRRAETTYSRSRYDYIMNVLLSEAGRGQLWR